MYPDLDKFQAVLAEIDTLGVLSSALFRRVEVPLALG